MNIENMKSTSGWQTEELAGTFLEGVRSAIPGVELQMRVLSRIVRSWFPKPSGIIDIGCGDGFLGRYLLELFPSSKAVFLDFSDPMLDAARKKLEDRKNAELIKADFSKSEWIGAAGKHAPFDIVISGFAIHHMTDVRKRELYTEIFGMLNPGGVFLNIEHVSSATESCRELFDNMFIDNLHAFHSRSDSSSDRKSIADRYYNRPDKKENILAPVEDQCRWMREIGFADVDCFFKLFEISLFGGRKL